MEVSSLEPEVINKLRCGICITSCAHAVEELVLNAVDAKATCIAVRINFQFFKIQVIDNGEGISFSDLEHVGERYMTSKCHTLEDLKHLKSGGFRGEALSSLKDISAVLEIVSRHYKSGQKPHSHFFLSHNSTPFLPRPHKLRKKIKCDSSPEGKSDFAAHPEELKNSLVCYLKEMEDHDLANKWKPGLLETVDSQVGEMFSCWENPVFLRSATQIDLPTAGVGGHPYQNQLKMCSIINSYRFSSTAFSQLQVLGQVDCKFLACIVQDVNENTRGRNLLVLFDQHAVHERIRLEQLINDLFEVDSKGQKVVKAAELSSPVVIHLRQEEIRILKAFLDRLAVLGLKLCILDSGDIEVYTVPICLTERENNDLKRKRQPVTAVVVENLIREWLISLEQTRSTSSVLPKTLMGILNSQACRGAVKFGDPLDLGQCQQLIQALSTCKLPFQCAHGRPSLAPLLELDKIINFSRKKPKPKLFKLIKERSVSYS